MEPGQFVRNGCYRVQANIDGLTGADPFGYDLRRRIGNARNAIRELGPIVNHFLSYRGRSGESCPTFLFTDENKLLYNHFAVRAVLFMQPAGGMRPDAGRRLRHRDFCRILPGNRSIDTPLDPSQEKAIRDLNIYLFHKSTDISKHIFSNDGTKQIDATLIKGDYDLFVIAPTRGNLGGELTRDQAERYALNISEESDLSANDVLPMSVRQSFSAKTKKP